MPISVAIDFETADNRPDSACAVGMARIEQGVVIDTFYSLIQPPRRRVFYTHIHGLTWDMLKDQPVFAEIWPAMRSFMDGASRLLAHNAPFDKRILQGCCTANNLAAPAIPFECTLKLSRRLLKLPSHSLHVVCQHCSIALNHHHAGSDALAAAELWLLFQRMC